MVGLLSSRIGSFGCVIVDCNRCLHNHRVGCVESRPVDCANIWASAIHDSEIQSAALLIFIVASILKIGYSWKLPEDLYA